MTDAVDRYSFGVILLELISGQPAVANGQCLSDRLRPLLDNVDALQVSASTVSFFAGGSLFLASDMGVAGMRWPFRKPV